MFCAYSLPTFALPLSDKTFVLAFVLTDDEAEEGAGGARVEKRKGFVGRGRERDDVITLFFFH